MYLAFRCVTVQTGLSGTVAPALAMVGVDGEVEVHDLSFELERGKVLGGHLNVVMRGDEQTYGIEEAH